MKLPVDGAKSGMEGLGLEELAAKKLIDLLLEKCQVIIIAWALVVTIIMKPLIKMFMIIKDLVVGIVLFLVVEEHGLVRQVLIVTFLEHQIVVITNTI